MSTTEPHYRCQKFTGFFTFAQQNVVGVPAHNRLAVLRNGAARAADGLRRALLGQLTLTAGRAARSRRLLAVLDVIPAMAVHDPVGLVGTLAVADRDQ
jgi:hypothetical protein